MAKERLIDANRAQQIAEVMFADVFIQRAFKLLLDALPTVDAVEVVRCNDCIYHTRCEMEDMMLCECENPYCPAGERETDGKG